MENSKPKWASKTLWINLVAAGGSLALLLGVDLGLDTAAQAEIVIGIMAVVNIGLRFMTTTAIK